MPTLAESGSDGEEAEANAEAQTKDAAVGIDSPSAEASCPNAFEGLGEPVALADNGEACAAFTARLELASRAEQAVLVDWLIQAIRPVALSRSGCRVVQKALEVAGSRCRDKLVRELGQFVVELYESPNGNHVLTKVVEVVPSAALGFIISQLQQKGATVVARHRFGCRVLERLIEHCSERESKGLMDQVVADAEMLARHQYGNFVVQHLLEHGTKEQRNSILDRLIHAVPRLAMHRTASHVVQRLLDYCDQDRQRLVVQELLRASGPNSLAEVACSRYGSFVAEQLAATGVGREDVRQQLAAHLLDLGKSQFGRRVAERFGLEVACSGSSPDDGAAATPSEVDE